MPITIPAMVPALKLRWPMNVSKQNKKPVGSHPDKLPDALLATDHEYAYVVETM
jgi:hypothetical protein